MGFYSYNKHRKFWATFLKIMLIKKILKINIYIIQFAYKQVLI